MKKLLIFLVLFSLAYQAFSQLENPNYNSNIKLIHYCWENNQLILKNVESYSDLKIGEFYYIKISGINQINYQVLINQKDTLTTQELKLPSIGDFNIEEITSSLASVNFSGSQYMGKSDGAEIMTLSKEKRIEYKRIEEVLKDEFQFKLRDARWNLSNYNNSLLKIESQINSKLDEINEYYFEIKKSIISAKLNSTQTSLSLDDKITTASQIRDQLSAIVIPIENDNTWNDFLKLEESLRIILGSYDFENLEDGLKERYKFNEASFQELVKQKGVVLDNIKALKGSLVAAVNSITGEDWEKSMNKVSFIQNLQNRDYYSLPIQYLGERNKTTISLILRDPEYKLNSYSTTFVFPLEKTPYFGVSSSFYISGLQSEVFSIKGNIEGDTVSNYSVIKEDGGNVEVGTAILAKFGKKFNNNLGGHFSLGAGISFTDNVRPRVLGGLGLTLGTKNSFAFDIGVIAGHVDQLSSAYDNYPNITYPSSPEQITYSKMGVSGFASLGYFFRF